MTGECGGNTAETTMISLWDTARAQEVHMYSFLSTCET